MSLTQAQAVPHIMRTISVGKVVLNIGVGKSGEAVERAKKLLAELTGQRPSVRRAKKTIRDFGIHKGEPIGVSVTVRGRRVIEMLKRLLATKGFRLPASAFDEHGCCSFGIQEQIDIPGVKYNPEIGIFGMDVSIVLERPGSRVTKRRCAASKVGRSHLVTRQEAITFFKQTLGVEAF